MRAKLAVEIVAGLAFLMVAVPASASAVKFDDITTEEWADIPGSYAGLNWSSNWEAGNGTVWTDSGYNAGRISGDYVAFNNYASDVTISRTSPFDLIGAYFTGAWNDGLNIQIQGRDAWGSLLYNQIIVVNATSPTWAQLDFSGVFSVDFHSWGGTQHSAYGLSGTHFAMDNLVYSESIPAPGAALLTILGASMVGWLRRRR